MAHKIICDICDKQDSAPQPSWAVVTVRPSDLNFALDVCPECALMLKSDVKQFLRAAFSEKINSRGAKNA
jgi:hypothetical protein